MATQQLGRRTSIGRLEFNPFTLRARLSDFVLSDRDPARTLAKFATLDLDVSIASLWKRAPVLDAVKLVRPQIDLVRNEDGRYSIQDLIERAPAQPEGRTPRFSINNIEVDDGVVSLDDRPHRRKITVSNIGIGIPFLSSFPYDAKIHVTPRLDGSVDGSRFALTGTSTSPFADTQQATLELNLDGLRLPRYAEYVSLPGAMTVADGALTTRLKLAFVTEKGAARAVSLSGTARADKLALARKDGSPIAGIRSIDAALSRLDWMKRAITLARVVIDAPEIDLRREADGGLELERVFAASAKQPPAQARTPAWSFGVAEGRITAGVVHVGDTSVSPPFKATLSNVVVEGRKLSSDGGPGTIDVAFDADNGAHFTTQGQVDLGKASARGHFALAKLPLGTLQPYYAPQTRADIRRGIADLGGDFDAANGGASARFALAKGTAVLSDLDVALPGEREPALRLARAEVGGIEIDSSKRSVTVDRVEAKQGSIRLLRGKDGGINFERFTHPAAALETAERRVAAKAATADAWNVMVRKVDAEQIAADFQDRAAETPVRLRVSAARIALANVGSDAHGKTTAEVTARIGSGGRLHVAGTVVPDPLAVDCSIDATGIDIVPLRPYFEPRVNVTVTSGAVTAKGRLTFATAHDGSPHARYTGDVTIGNFSSLDRPTSQDLMRWKTLTITGVDASTEPFKATLGAVAMDEFYARVILNADATLNLQQLLAPESAAARAASQGPSSTLSGVTTKELAPAGEGRELPVSIGRIQLSKGEVQYSDFFVKPNYTTHLTDVEGSVSALSASQAGTVEIKGRVEGTAPVDVRGTVNPFAQQLALDLTGKATDIDLPPLTPYSVKYAGYGIQKGKLSLEVHYKVEERKLAATNTLTLDQLTFGEHVDSPTATRLPVLLAVSLLKDRNGVINLDLPISGTLDDPQFSVWGVLVQIFVNLITKAVTAPFALLGSIGGGGGEQLAYVDFAPGHAELSAAAQTKLRTLAKALDDRPALKIDAAGRAIPDVDREGLKHAMLDHALRVQKQKAVGGEGESAPSADALTIGADEYPKLLTAAYRDADLPNKPRNMLGIAKTIPPAEMEALLLASYRIDDPALTALANRRAQAVKGWLAGEGAVSPERIFIVAPKLGKDGIKDDGAPTRVDFAIR